jgi:adenylate cyclase
MREVTILFADICGFTSMSERMSPSAVAILLNEYLGSMTEAIFDEEGTLDKYIGDAIMAVFGAPLDMPDHAARAIRAALGMRARLEEFNAERTAAPGLRIRIGLNTGKVLACEIGGQNKREYTVLGDAVNVASRLESSVAKPMMIVIGEETYAAVTGQFEMRSLGTATLKGKEKQVGAWEVIGELGDGRREPPPEAVLTA